MQPGVQPNGLFWTTRVPHSSFSANEKHARFKVKDLPLVESFEFFGPHQVPASVSIDLKWKATSKPQHRGKGSTVAPEDPAAFTGHFADAVCTGTVSGKRMGFSFDSEELTSTGYYASMGHERNGAFLD